MKWAILLLIIFFVMYFFKFLKKNKANKKEDVKIVDLEKDPKTDEYKPKE